MKQEPTQAARSGAEGIPVVHGREDVNVVHTAPPTRCEFDSYAQLGVDRVVLLLPTAGETETLKKLDEWSANVGEFTA